MLLSVSAGQGMLWGLLCQASSQHYLAGLDSHPHYVINVAFCLCRGDDIGDGCAQPSFHQNFLLLPQGRGVVRMAVPSLEPALLGLDSHPHYVINILFCYTG